jgi:hypothetical protein
MSYLFPGSRLVTSESELCNHGSGTFSENRYGSSILWVSMLIFFYSMGVYVYFLFILWVSMFIFYVYFFPSEAS